MVVKFLAEFFAPEIRAWRGAEPLWKVFWIYGVTVSAVLAAAYAGALYGHEPELEQILLVAFAPYTLWILVSVWRCAENTRQRHWGVLARFLTIAWAANTLMILLFLEADLLTVFFGD